jgi:putative hemolysin
MLALSFAIRCFCHSPRAVLGHIVLSSLQAPDEGSSFGSWPEGAANQAPLAAGKGRTIIREEENLSAVTGGRSSVVWLAAVEADISWWGWLGLLSIPALVLLNAFFVIAEFALVAVRRTRIEALARQGVSAARLVESVKDKLDRYIAATQLGVTLATLGLGWVAEPALAETLLPLFQAWGPFWQVLGAHSLAASLAFLLITYVHVIFGELVPKTLALQRAEPLSLWVVRPLVLFTRLTRPLVLSMSAMARAVVRLLGLEPTGKEGLVHSVEELELLVEDTEEAGLLSHDQVEFVTNVFRLSNKRVQDCMVPREKMAALELNLPPDKVLEVVRQGAHTRLPVYEGTLDNIVGIVNTKDLFYLFSQRGLVVLEDALYPPLFLKPEERVANALRLFRQAHRPMALVRDSTGKILGLITLEDILEEIVGDIEDEHDRPTPKLILRRSRTPRSEGSTGRK